MLFRLCFISVLLHITKSPGSHTHPLWCFLTLDWAVPVLQYVSTHVGLWLCSSLIILVSIMVRSLKRSQCSGISWEHFKGLCMSMHLWIRRVIFFTWVQFWPLWCLQALLWFAICHQVEKGVSHHQAQTCRLYSTLSVLFLSCKNKQAMVGRCEYLKPMLFVYGIFVYLCSWHLKCVIDVVDVNVVAILI